jgi:two-component system, sensor histidine kinase RegB
MPNTHPAKSFVQLRLTYLLLLRLFAVGGQLLALGLMVWVFELPLPWLPITVIISLLLIYTLFSWRHAREAKASSDGAIVRQLLADVGALSGVVYFTGGSANPFITLFLLPITFAAASLRPRHTWLIATTAIVAYTLLMFFHQPLLHQQHHHPAHAADGFSLHLWGMWYGFIISAALLAFFVARIGTALRERDRALAAAREEALRGQQLVAMGTLAAGTAHELGTPLSTMAIVVNDLEHEYREQPQLAESLQLLRQQIARCKTVLARMAADAGELQADAGRQQPVDKYLKTLVAEWQQLRQDVELEQHWRGSEPAPAIITDRVLTQALLNVLNNAADAAISRVTIAATWSDDLLSLEVTDDGSGMDQDARLRAGVVPYSSKPAGEGLGLGLFLARTTLQRFGGRLELHDAPEGGVRVSIMLPLQPILAGNQ